MEIPLDTTRSADNPNPTPPGEQSRRTRNRQRNAHRNADPPTGPREDEHKVRQQRHTKPPRGNPNTQARSSPSSSQPALPDPPVVDDGSGTQKKRPPRRRNLPKEANATPGSSTQDVKARPDIPTRRGAKFNAGLTDPNTDPSSTKPSNRYRNKRAAAMEPEADDLTSRLIQALRTHPYPDCPICFSSIHPAQRVWSCSPSIPVIRPPDAESDEQQYCWTTFHLHGTPEARIDKEIGVAQGVRRREKLYPPDIGAFATPPRNQNLPVLPPHIPVATLALVCARRDAGTHVP
ncbi:hypothetical protein H0H81_006146 [Sphagnurus paluster]|uniref:Uncharacterized protein n=1 Tax=Sphagnurus paluster TaxID=117069 RepID=A0A9P7FY71_9AGAR|nr:hypothetical protein H0H81_006146 [Sphagnurus paluster]